MKKRKVLTLLLTASVALASCGKAPVEETTEVTTEETTTTVAETTAATPTPRPTATPTPLPTATPTPIPRDGTARFADPFDDESEKDFLSLNEMSDDTLQGFTDLFFTDWYWEFPESAEEMERIGDSTYYLIPDNGLNYRPAWLYTSYRDPRDCNPYIDAGWLQYDGYVFGGPEDEGIAYLTPSSVADAQIREFTGYSNSELSNPLGISESHNGETYVVFGPMTNGGIPAYDCISGRELEDGNVILVFGNSEAGGGLVFNTGTIAVMAPNGDGTYRILNNHNTRNIITYGSADNEVSSDMLREGITEAIDRRGVNFGMPDDADQYDVDESLRFSAYVSRNAYLASYGVIFDDPLLQFWFESCSWYEPVIPESEFDYSVMSDIELSNIEQADALLAELG